MRVLKILASVGVTAWFYVSTILPYSQKNTTADLTPHSSKLFSYMYGIRDDSFCLAETCVDYWNDGKREITFASRATKRVSMLSGADGRVIWNVPIEGESQSMAAYDTDGDGTFEIFYSTSDPGKLHLLEPFTGKLLRSLELGDIKLGNSPLIIDGDGKLDAYFGTRGKYLVRMNVADFSMVRRRPHWVQCGSYTSAIDVEKTGRWALFTGSGDDRIAKGVMHRYDPVTLESIWTYPTNDNASSASAVLIDLDGDGRVDVLKSVDNLGKDDAHDAVYAFTTDGRVLWRVNGFSGEDSPNVADLDGDGTLEIVGMTFGGEVYCLDAKGRVKWRRDLRPEFDNSAHAYMAPILCDLNGERQLEVLAITNGGYFDEKSSKGHDGNGVLFALNSKGDILDRFDLGRRRYYNSAYVCNVDQDPYLELVLAGSGGLDVIKTEGIGPNTEHFQRRRTYQRLEVLPWAYEDSYFIYRGKKEGVRNLTDNLILDRKGDAYKSSGKFTTELLTLPPKCHFDRLQYAADLPEGTRLEVNILDQNAKAILKKAPKDTRLEIRQPVVLEFVLSTANRQYTPKLDSYVLSFDRDRR